MSKAENQKEKFPLGLTEDQVKPIEIKSVRKQKGKYTIELAPKVEKQIGANYHYEFSEGKYLIKGKNKTLKTPGGKPVLTNSEPLAIKAIEHLEAFGEDYTMAYSIVCFLYSNIDFFEPKPKEELESYILNDLETDWTFRNKFTGNKSNEKYRDLFDNYDNREGNLKEWLKGLSKSQVGGVVVMGASLRSVNTAYILSNFYHKINLQEFTEYYDKCYHKYHNKAGGGMYGFHSLEQTHQIFENYLSWQGLGI